MDTKGKLIVLSRNKGVFMAVEVENKKRHPRKDVQRNADVTKRRFSAASTAQATVQPTIALLPMPRNPIISTCAGTDEEPAN